VVYRAANLTICNSISLIRFGGIGGFWPFEPVSGTSQCMTSQSLNLVLQGEVVDGCARLMPFGFEECLPLTMGHKGIQSLQDS
jgi:hypothetical protein